MKGVELNQSIKQIGFVVILSFIFCVMIVELNYFISSLLGSFTLYMLLRKPMRKLEAKGWSTTAIAILFVTSVSLFAIMIGSAFAGTIYVELRGFHPQIIIDNVHQVREFILTKTGYDIVSKDVASETIITASRMLPEFFSITGNIATNALMMVFILFFMLQQSRAMEKGIEDHLPLSHDSIAILKHETKNMVVSNAIGVPVIMIGQALVAILGYWVLGIDNFLVWGALTGLCGLIPVIGSAVIWIPLAINLFVAGEMWQGILLLVYGILIISGVDYVIRMYFMEKYADVHPLITIFGVILGMNIFGFWGIIFGPLMISGFLILLKIYKNEFLES